MTKQQARGAIASLIATATYGAQSILKVDALNEDLLAGTGFLLLAVGVFVQHHQPLILAIRPTQRFPRLPKSLGVAAVVAQWLGLVALALGIVVYSLRA